MKITSAIALCLAGASNGWVLRPPKRIIKKSVTKDLLIGAAGSAAIVAGTAAATVGVVGAAAALSQANVNREVYEPAPGSMIDQVVIVTGGSSGLGLETAKRLAAAGAAVVLTSRSEAKGTMAVEEVKNHLTSRGVDASKVYYLLLELDDLSSSVKQFATKYAALNLGDITVLVNNAGVMAIPDLQQTVDGYERTFQSNHLGHFVLTSELFPYFSRDGTRIINVSSSAANLAAPGLDMGNLNGEKSYGAWSSYGTSKLANILFTQELQRRASAEGQDWLTTAALHPGVVNTDLWRYLVGEEKMDQFKSLQSLAKSATSLFTKTPEEGASTQIFLAASDNIAKGAFYEDMKEKKNLPAFSEDADKAKALWEVSEELGGIQFDLVAGAEGEIVDIDPEESTVEQNLEETPIEDGPLYDAAKGEEEIGDIASEESTAEQNLEETSLEDGALDDAAEERE